MKYPLSNGRVGVIQWNQEIAKKCYVERLKLKRARTVGVNTVNMKVVIKPPENVSTKKGITNPNEENMKSADGER